MARSNTDKARKNFLMPRDLADWVEKYASDHNTTMTRLIVDYFTNLRRETENGHAEQV